MKDEYNEQRVDEFNLPKDIASVDQLPLERKTKP